MRVVTSSRALLSCRVRSEETDSGPECLQLLHHRACRHHLVLLYPREILVLDLEINQTVAIVPLERSAASLQQVRATRAHAASLQQVRTARAQCCFHFSRRVLFERSAASLQRVRASRVQCCFSLCVCMCV